MTRSPKKQGIRNRLAFLLAAGLALQGCVPYTSNYMPDPRTRNTTTGIDRATANEGPAHLTLLTQPGPADPFVPFSARLSRTLTGPEATITTFRENSYKYHWTPFLIPVGLIIVPSAPFAFLGGILSGDGDKAVKLIFGGDPDPCRHGMFAFGLHAIVGIDTSCAVVDSRTGEEKTPTWKTVTQEVSLGGKPVEIRLAARGEAPIVRTIVTDPEGNASLALNPLFVKYRDTPTDLEVVLRAAGEAGSTQTIRIDDATSRRIYQPIAEEREGDRTLSEGKGLVALDHFSRAHELLSSARGNEESRAFVWQKIAATYRSLPVKPPVPEDARRLLVQAQTLSNNNDAAGGIAKLNEILWKTPWLPIAWYNLAMAESMEKHYPAAINAMNGYLKLTPESPDTRMAKDKIYEWETMSPASAQPGETFSGIGLELGKTDGRIVATRVIPGGPASAVDIQPGDILEQIDRTSTENMEVADVIRLIRGSNGTSVSLQMLRPGNGKRIRHNLKRAVISAGVRNR